MPATAARAAAFAILLRVEQEDAYASELLHSARAAKLSPADHSLATELVMGVQRWRSMLDRNLASVSSQRLDELDAEVLTALRLGVYQLDFLSRIPPRAAIYESVELTKAARKRSAAAFVNAVLRKIDTKSAPAAEIDRATDAKNLSESAAHPEWLVTRWIERYGLEVARKICVYDQAIPETSIYVDDTVEEELRQAGIRLEAGQILAQARRLRSGDVQKARSAREGRIAIQDEASQLVALLVGHGQTILDCCAAPGSKTALIARRNPRSRVMAVELYPHRSRLMQKLAWQRNIQIVAADARQLPFAIEFERILADVPCSGTGTLARNPEIKWRLTLPDLSDLQSRQIAILNSALNRLVSGGRLVYSTCSLEREENEAVVEAVLQGTTDFTLVDVRSELEELQRTGELAWPDFDSLVAGPYLRTIPGVHPGDGFFAAIMEWKG